MACPHDLVDLKQVPHWLDVLGHSRHRICTPEIASTSISQPAPLSHTYNTTSNWAGIAAVNGGYNYAFADWIVPCYTGGNSSTRQLQWVGRGSANIWQGGTESDYPQGYRFWYEAFPKTSITFAGPAVGCSDHVAVQVDFNTTVANQSYIFMSNYSNGQYWSKTYGNGFVPGSNQVEWINERPSCSGGLWALQPTGTTSWTYAQAESRVVNNDALEPAGAYNYQIISMYQGSTELAGSSDLLSDQESFFVNYYHTGTSSC
ncbi:MAG: G1 family glutamic endopeptidase [Ktedonobacterales bacterium]